MMGRHHPFSVVVRPRAGEETTKLSTIFSLGKRTYIKSVKKPEESS